MFLDTVWKYPVVVFCAWLKQMFWSQLQLIKTGTSFAIIQCMILHWMHCWMRLKWSTKRANSGHHLRQIWLSSFGEKNQTMTILLNYSIVARYYDSYLVGFRLCVCNFMFSCSRKWSSKTALLKSIKWVNLSSCWKRMKQTRSITPVCAHKLLLVNGLGFSLEKF